MKTAVSCGCNILLAASVHADNNTNSRAVEVIVGEPAALITNISTPPLGLPPLVIPAGNPVTTAKIDLGRKLFFDRRLSFNRTLSCAMCHVPEQGFTQNELRTPVGIEGRFVKRNSPSLLNVGYRRVLFHDGREATLENQIWQPLLNSNEMANPSIGYVLATIREATDYHGLFEAIFPQGLTVETLGMALASYERGLVSASSAFDRWYFGRDKTAIPPAAVRGWQLFRDSGCTGCHTVAQDYAQFTDDAFYDTGIGYARTMGVGRDAPSLRLAPGVEVVPTVTFAPPPANDLGRYEATRNSADRWLYRVPTLRNAALTGPYMHDGSLPSLASVVDYYNSGGVQHPGLDPRVRPLELSEQQQADLVAFLLSLTGSNVRELVRDARSQRIGDTQCGAKPCQQSP
jgi:cytochrome c peroxidase